VFLYFLKYFFSKRDGYPGCRKGISVPKLLIVIIIKSKKSLEIVGNFFKNNFLDVFGKIKADLQSLIMGTPIFSL
jgi:hypothetical protein